MSEKKKWTLMFFFASDNPLAASIVSQLKAIKQAGYHTDANVVTQFDPQAPGAPTHLFDVNIINKLKNPNRDNRVGFGRDSFVRNLIEDKLWGDELGRDGKIRDLVIGRLREEIGDKVLEYPSLTPANGNGASAALLAHDHGPGSENGNRKVPVEPGPQEALRKFLSDCLDKYRADRYMLFILGHGMVVGNDAFLYDEHAGKPSMTLTELGKELGDFATAVRAQKSAFELVGFHSCSVSSLEVAYELQGTADYMLASQGPAFVGSWPYRNILIRIFNELDQRSRTEPNDPRSPARQRVEDIFDYCYYNSMDYLLAGYSFDLTLCDLSRSREVVKERLQKLSDALAKGVLDPLLGNLILLAHWRSQSYWQENYTDLYDFCFCLSRYLSDYQQSAGMMTPAMEQADLACGLVMDSLAIGGGLVVRNEFAGPAYQYSHGLSVYFPWSRPSNDNPLWFSEDLNDKRPGAYGKYFFDETRWRLFLDSYFTETERKPRKGEPDSRIQKRAALKPHQRLDEDMAYHVYNKEGSLSSTSALKPPKTNPYDATGDCDCTTVKNFPRDTRSPADKGNPPKEDSDAGVVWASQGYSHSE